MGLPGTRGLEGALGKGIPGEKVIFDHSAASCTNVGLHVVLWDSHISHKTISTYVNNSLEIGME